MVACYRAAAGVSAVALALAGVSACGPVDQSVGPGPGFVQTTTGDDSTSLTETTTETDSETDTDTDPTGTASDTEDTDTSTTTDETETETDTDTDPTTTSPVTTEPPDSCDDGEQNQDETDIDCGGTLCPACGLGESCEIHEDCELLGCIDGVCIDPICVTDDDCDHLNDDCSVGVCLPDRTCAAYPANDGQPCDVENLCSDSLCSDGACELLTAIDCSFFDDQCTVGVCDPEDGLCYNNVLADDTPCDDGNGCTEGDACQAGACVSPDGDGFYFSEDFSSPDPEWKLGPLWEFGAAVASPPSFLGQDPAEDHTDTDDNKLAGVVIGGVDDIVAHPDYCLTSPSILADVPGELWLTFWRHLHADLAPKVISRVDVWNGNAWITVDEGYEQIVNDAEWKEFNFDVTAYKGTKILVRFCVRRQLGSANHPSWSVDDVTFAPKACTP